MKHVNRIPHLIKELIEKGHQRILILGSPGSGKSTLAKVINADLKLPLTSMDELYWGKQWVRCDENQFTEKLKRVVTEKQWMIDGNYFRYLPERLHHADAIILVNTSTFKCLWRAFKRFLYRRWTNDKEGFQFQIAWKLFINILTFSRITLPKMHELFEKSTLPIYILTLSRRLK